MAEQGHGRVSKVDFGNGTRQRTNWWRDRATGGSAEWILGRRRDNAPPDGGTEPRVGQQGGFRGADETTHILVARQGHRMISRVNFGEQTRQHTNWWQGRATGWSAEWISGSRRDNAHTEDHIIPHEH